MNNKQPKIQEPKQEPVKKPQMSKQNNPVLKQTQPKITQPKTSAFKPDKKIEKYANSNQFRVDHAHDFDDDYEQKFKDNDFDSNEKDVFDLGVEKYAESEQFRKDHTHDFDDDYEAEFKEESEEPEDLEQAVDDIMSTIAHKSRNVDKESFIKEAKKALMLEYDLEPGKANDLAIESFERLYEDDFDNDYEDDLSSNDNSNNNSGEVGDLGHTLDELEDSGIFNVKMVDKEGNIVFDGNSMDAPLWDENGNEYAIDKIDKDELNRSGIIHLKSGSNNQSLELKHKQLEELIPEDKREQTKLLLDYFVNDLGIDEETALDSIIESAKKVKKL